MYRKNKTSLEDSSGKPKSKLLNTKTKICMEKDERAYQKSPVNT